MSLKQQYTQNVLPIQNALKERDAAIKMDRELKMRDSSYQTQFDPSKIAVTDYLNNNNAFSARGVSGQEVYKDAAQALSTLKDVATSELPALRGSGITDKYFTLMKQGLSPEQAAALMQKQSHSQAESESWSKLAKMTVSAIDGAMQRHGVYDVFKDNPKMIDKFWQDTSKAAIFAVGTPKIGEMTDEMEMYKRKKALEVPPPNEQLMDEERFVPSFNKEGLAKINTLRENAKGNFKYNVNLKDIGEGIAVGSGRAPLYIGGNQKAQGANNAILKAKKDAALNELNVNAKQLGIKPFKYGSMDYNKWVDAVAGAMEEKFKFSNKSKTISNIDKDVAGGIYSEVRGRNGGKLKDSEGNTFEVAKESETNTVPSFDFNNGFVLSVPGKNGELHEVPFKVEDLHISDLSRNYNLIRDVESGKYQKSDIGFTDDQYEDFKNSTVKAIRTRLSLKPGASVAKPKLGNE